MSEDTWEFVLEPDLNVKMLDDKSPRKRFVSLLKAAWQQIPVEHRECMSRYIKNTSYDKMFTCEIHDLKDGFAHAQIKSCGTALWCSANTLENMDDSVAMALLGHELAHIYQYAKNSTVLAEFHDREFKRPSKSAASCIRRKHYIAKEQEADDIAKEWGFDPKLISTWKVDQMVKKYSTEDKSG